jgi:hypothetical protein
MELYRERLWRAWCSNNRNPDMIDIPVSKAQLMARVGGDSFDGGRTASWVSSLGEKATWRAVRVSSTGHTIHIVSDRPFADLTEDLHLGLRLMTWMSRRPVTWYWWDQPWKRVMPANEDPRKEHLNGGWAVPGVLEVHVYRREEAHKVMLHEMVHALGLDVKPVLVEPVRLRFEQLFGRQLWPHLGEAYTELFAEWLWCIARAASLGEATQLWSYQVECSTSQAAIVWARIRDATIDEDTNVFAYYVLKWVLMRSHLTESLIGPNHSVRHWFTWFMDVKSELDDMATRAAHTENKMVNMGMTCATGLR